MLLIITLIHGEKVGVLEQLMKPDSIEVSQDRLYVVEGSTFLVYSLKDAKLITTFGKRGEGPGELKVVPGFPNNIKVIGDILVVEGFDKLLYYLEDFKLEKEIKKKSMIFQMLPIEDNFVGIRFSPTGKSENLKLSLILWNNQMKEIKELHTQEIRKRDKEILLVVDSIHYSIYRGKIFVEKSNQGFLIEVFDKNGNRLYEINNYFEPHKSNKKDKKERICSLKGDSFIQMISKTVGGWENFLKTSSFYYPEFFPAIQDMVVSEGKIHVSTYIKRENTEKYIVLDLNGKIINTKFLPVPQQPTYPVRVLGKDNKYYGFANNRYYYLVENEGDENWELHAEPLN
jgi:hypothetical protein